MSGEESAVGGLQGHLEQLLDEIESGTSDASTASNMAGDIPNGRVTPAPPTDLLGGLLADPALLSKLPSLLGAISPLLRGGGNSADGSGAANGPHPARKLPDRHTALLRALKPYLSPERRRATETLLVMLELWDALSGMGIAWPTADRGTVATAATAGEEVADDV